MSGERLCGEREGWMTSLDRSPPVLGVKFGKQKKYDM